MDNIVPDLAESWSWSEDGKELTFKLRQGVKWHDGKPFTAADVRCTMDLIQGKAKERFAAARARNGTTTSRRSSTNGDYEAVFKLERPQPALLMLLASGYSPIYPCHVVAAADAAAPDRHGAVQVCRVQTERGDQGRQEPGLLEEGPAVSRRDRIQDRAEPFDGDPRLCRRAVRHDVAVYDHPGAAARRQEPAAGRGVRDARRRTARPICWSIARNRPSTIPNCARRWRWRSTARPLSIS